MSKPRYFSGVVETCCHRVAFWYELGRIRLSPFDMETIAVHAEERAKEMIVEGFYTGDLCSLLNRRKEQVELRGAWEINDNLEAV